MSKKSQKILRITVILIVVLLVVALVAFICTNISKEDKKAKFYLVHNDTQITKDITDLVLEKGASERFDLKYFSGSKNDKQSYYVTVECIPDGYNFNFNIDGKQSSFRATKSDVTEFFKIDVKDDYFTITLDKDFKATDVIEKVYSDKKVTFPYEIDYSKSFFKIVVHLKDGTPVYSIGFICEYGIEGINIDKGTVPDYFGGDFNE